MYRNIMVPFDGSSFSREAVVQGLRLASGSGATLRLVRVGTVSVLSATSEGANQESSRMEQMHAAQLSELYALALECRANSSVNVTASMQTGPVADALMGYARRHKVELIVMRSHARKGLARMWFGSIADTLIRESGIPVLVVRQPSVATALESGFRFKRILVPLDTSALAAQALASASAIARIEGASITLLSVVTPSDERNPGELESTIGHAGADHVATVKRHLEAVAGSPLLRAIEVTTRVVVTNDIPGAILNTASACEADLISIATRGRGAIPRASSGSVADAVMRQAAVSVMVVHPEMRAQQTVPTRITEVAAAVG